MILLLFRPFPPSHHIIFFITFQSLARFFFSLLYIGENCVSTQGICLPSLPFRLFGIILERFQLQLGKHVQLVNTISTSTLCQKIGLLLLLLLYLKPFFSDYLYSYVYLATQNYPGSSSSRNAIPPSLCSFTGLQSWHSR